MRAAVFHAARDIRVADVPAPSGLGPREVLLRPIWCGVCGTDLHEFAQGPIVIPAEPHPLMALDLMSGSGFEGRGAWAGGTVCPRERQHEHLCRLRD